MNLKLAFFMMTAIAVNYIDRVNISHALVPMSRDLQLNALEQGVVLSAFSWGYVGFMAVGGYLCDRIGPYRMASIAASSWSIATVLSGLSFSQLSMTISRILVGVGEAPIFPAFASIVRKNYPLDQRGRATAIFDAGSYVGTALSAPIVVSVILLTDWRVSFFVCGLMGIVWVFFWNRYCSSNDLVFRYKKEELKLSKEIFIELLQNRKVLSASFGFFSYNYSKSFFLTWFPSYLIAERNFDLFMVGVVGIIPPICAAAGSVMAGAATDLMIVKRYPITIARKIPICLGLVLSITISFAAVVESPWISLAILTFAFTATISASPGIWAIPGDIAPHDGLVATIGGIQNTFSNTAGIIAPVITGALIYYTESFTWPLVLTAVLCILGAISYWFGVGKLEPIKLKGGRDGS